MEGRLNIVAFKISHTNWENILNVTKLYFGPQKKAKIKQEQFSLALPLLQSKAKNGIKLNRLTFMKEDKIYFRRCKA